MILANRNFAFNCGSVAVFVVCCGLRKESCAAINAQIIKTRRLEKIKQEGWKDQARRLERSSMKAGKDQAIRLAIIKTIRL